MPKENPFYVDPKVAKQKETDIRLEHLKHQTESINRRKDERALRSLSKGERMIVQELRKLTPIVTDHSVGSPPLTPKSSGKVDKSAITPVGVTENDLLRWDGTAWVILSAPPATGAHFLAVDENVMYWQEISTTCTEA